MEEECEKYKKRLDEYNQMKNDNDLKAHRLELLNKKLRSNTSFKSQERIENLQLQLDDLLDHIKELKEQQKGYEKEVHDIRKEKTSATKGTKQAKEILTEQGEKLKIELEKLQ